MVKRITKPALPAPLKLKVLPATPKPIMEAFRAENGEGPVSTLVRVLDEGGLGSFTAEDFADGTVDRFSNNQEEHGRFTLARGADGVGVILAAWEGKYWEGK